MRFLGPGLGDGFCGLASAEPLATFGEAFAFGDGLLLAAAMDPLGWPFAFAEGRFEVAANSSSVA